MSFSDPVILAPVSITDVSTALGLSSKSLSVLCKSSANINLWAKYRPISYNSSSELTDTQRESVNFGWTIPTYTNKNTFINSYSTRWTANLPAGTSTSPCRLLDFNGYCKDINNWAYDATCPSGKNMSIVFFGSFQSSGTISGSVVKMKTGNTFTIEAEPMNPDGATLEQYLFPMDTILHEYYLGIALIQGTKVSITTTNNTVMDSTGTMYIRNFAIPTSTTLLSTGSFVAVPCFSKVKSYNTWSEAFTTGRINSGESLVTFNGCYMNCEKTVVATMLEYDILWSTNGGIMVEFEYAVTNNTTTLALINPFFVILFSEDTYNRSDFNIIDKLDYWVDHGTGINGNITDNYNQVVGYYYNIGSTTVNANGGTDSYNYEVYLQTFGEFDNGYYICLCYYDNVGRMRAYDMFNGEQ